MHLVPFRYLTFIATAAIFVLSLFYYDHYWLPLLAGALTLLGISDLLQTNPHDNTLVTGVHHIQNRVTDTRAQFTVQAFIT